ncbi:hypothetical protein LDO32_00705 [Luteimonas sp. Y-2-2-4F]|nr:hypothetical protein [Luteimonas sp. Y-2-2-4F]
MTASPLATRIGRFALANPLVCGAGEPVMTEAGIRAALDAGAAGVVAKSVNENPAAGRQLARADYLRLDARGAPDAWHGDGAGLFNRSGLQPREAGDWFDALAALDREASREGRFVAASVVMASAEGAAALARSASDRGLRVFELNVGAPHASEAAPGAIVLETDPARLQATVARVRAAAPDLQLWVKLTGLSSQLPALAVAARAGGADAVAMMGRFMAFVPDVETLAPALGTSAAYGGPWALPIVCRHLALSRRALGPEVPLIGTNGVRHGEDIARMALAGASACEALSAVMLEGFGALRRMLDELEAYLQRKRLPFRDLVGLAADRLQGYAEQAEDPARWRRFVPPQTLD